MKKKLTMSTKDGITLEEGCNLHLESCRHRNLREGTIRHYKDCYVQFKKYFSDKEPKAVDYPTKSRYGRNPVLHGNLGDYRKRG